MAEAMVERSEQTARKQYFWTTVEVAVLTRLCTSGAVWEEFENSLPGRTQVGIYQKAVELGLDVPWVRATTAANDDLDEDIRKTLGSGKERGAVKALADKYKLPSWQISRRATQLGLTAPRLKEPDWCDEELRILDHAGEAGPSIAHRELRLSGYERTVSSVVSMMKRRRVERMASPSMSARGVAEMMGVDGKTVVRWIEVLGLEANRVEGTWRIGKAELRHWLISHPTSFELRKVRQEWFMALMRVDGAY